MKKMEAIRKYKECKKIDKIFDHIAEKEQFVFLLSLNWELFRLSVRPAIEDFLKECESKNLDYKQQNWMRRIRKKQIELFGFRDE